jgi:hypothetical protein
MENLPQPITIQELAKRKEDTAKDYEEALKNSELVRKAKPATVEMVETINAKLDGHHWQLVNANKSLEAISKFFDGASKVDTVIKKVPHGKFVGWSIILLDIAFVVLLNCFDKSNSPSAPMTVKDISLLVVWGIECVMCGYAAYLLIENGE